MADPADLFAQAVNQAGRIVRNVKADQLDDATPCTDWSVRDLINHTVVGVQQFDAAIRGEGFDTAAYGNDVLGDDPVQAYEDAAESLRTALSRPSVLDEPWAMPGGPTPGAQAVHVGIVELQQHAWDLARATGQAAGFDPEVAEAAQMGAEGLVAAYGRAPGAFGDEVGAPPSAPPEDRLAAFLGRRP